MATRSHLRAVIVGCGYIAERYAGDLLKNDVVELVGFHDVDPRRARQFADTYGGEAFDDLDAAVAICDLVINLTIFEAHYPVSRAALEAGRHVYSEKPVALRLDHALELGELSDRHGVRLAAAPFTFLGAAQARVIDMVRDGHLGEVRVAYAEVNHGRIETWHPNPAPFYAAGPMLDVGVYPLALLTAALGPVSTVQAMSSTVLADRVDVAGNTFTPASPDYWLVELRHAGGATARLSVNFYVLGDEGIDFHGDTGSLSLESWFSPDARVDFTPYGGETTNVEVEPVDPEIDWSVGVAELVAAIEEDRPSRLDKDQAIHLVDIIDGMAESARSNSPVEMKTGFEPI